MPTPPFTNTPQRCRGCSTPRHTPTRWASPAVFALMAAILVWGSFNPIAAHAQDSIHKSPHDEDTHRIVGVKALQLTSAHQGEVKLGVGGGLALEHSLLHGWLEAELVSAAIRLDDELLIPIDLIVKKPFHFGVFCPYVGGGLAMTFLPAERQSALGGSLVIGSYLWLWGDVGIDIELEYNLLREGGLVQEIILGAGPSLRF